MRARAVSVVAAVVVTVVGLYVPVAEAAAGWARTGAMATSRGGHTATLLRDGRVLVVGGGSGAELYDPATRGWSSAANMTTSRSQHAATLLADGRVLVTGGLGTTPGELMSSAEIYDPAADQWSSAASMTSGFTPQTATLLADGRVLVTGTQLPGTRPRAELYDPATNAWSGAGSMPPPLSGYRATRLADGRVLVTSATAGDPRGAAVFDPQTNTWSSAGQMSAGWSYTATRLADGRILLVGGVVTPHGATRGYSPAEELYDPATGTWSALRFSSRREKHTATLLGDGTVLVVGGLGPFAASDLYDPAGGQWSLAGDMSAKRYDHTATLLADGRVLVAGGFKVPTWSLAWPEPLTSAEIYTPATLVRATPIDLGARPVGVPAFAETVVLNAGRSNLFIESATIGGADADDFVTVGDGCTGQIVAPAQACRVAVRFTADSARAYSATLTLADNSATANTTVALTGRGVDTTAPSITRLALSARAFTVARNTKGIRAPGGRKPNTGTRIRFRLSEPARVGITISRAHPGRRAGGRCVTPTTRNRRGRPCTRYRTTAALAPAARPAGANTIAFIGRIAKRALAPGRYRLTVTATDTAGNHAQPRNARFTIVP